jgi:hypothetical protein
MELFRALAVFAETPDRAGVGRVAEALGLGRVPEPSAYTDIFVFQLYPYASVYLGDEGMLGGEARDRIAGFLKALGQEPPRESDHLATLLGAYAALCASEESADDARVREHLPSTGPGPGCCAKRSTPKASCSVRRTRCRFTYARRAT